MTFSSLNCTSYATKPDGFDDEEDIDDEENDDGFEDGDGDDEDSNAK